MDTAVQPGTPLRTPQTGPLIGSFKQQTPRSAGGGDNGGTDLSDMQGPQLSKPLPASASMCTHPSPHRAQASFVRTWQEKASVL